MELDSEGGASKLGETFRDSTWGISEVNKSLL